MSGWCGRCEGSRPTQGRYIKMFYGEDVLSTLRAGLVNLEV